MGAHLRRYAQPAIAPEHCWQGAAARALFHRLYARLTPAAERHIAARFEGVDGSLPAQTALTRERLAGMA